MRRLVLPGVVTVVIAALTIAVVMPICCLIILGFQTRLGLFRGPLTVSNYTSLLTSASTRTELVNTAVFTAGAAMVAVILGTIMAFAVTSVRIPGRSMFRVLPIFVLILPPLVKDPAWVILLSPRTGLINLMLRDVFGIHSPVNVFTLYGMIGVTGIFAAPMAYVIMLTPLEGIDRSFFDASRMSGAKLRTTIARVVLPMIRPAVLSAVTLLVIVIASTFETPIIIGMPANIPTFMSEIYNLVHSPISGLNPAAAQGSLYLVLTTLMVGLYLMATRNERRFVAISGRGHTHELLEGRWLRYGLAAFMAVYSLLAFIGPLAVTILTSLIRFYSAVNGNPFRKLTFWNYEHVFTDAQVYHGIEFSAGLGILVAFGAVIVAGLLAIVALKSQSRFRRVCELVAMAPIAAPALVYSVGLLLTVLSIGPLTKLVYGSTALMFVAEVVVFLPITMRTLSSSIIQVEDQLLEASAMSGAHSWRTIRSILLPIVRPAIFYTASVVFVFSFRELGAIVFLVPANTSVVPNLSLTYYISGGFPMLAALNMVALVVPLLLICAFTALGRIGRTSTREVAVRPDLIPSIPTPERELV